MGVNEGAAVPTAQPKAAAFDTTAPAYPPMSQEYPAQSTVQGYPAQGFPAQQQQHSQQQQQWHQQQQPPSATQPAYNQPTDAPSYVANRYSSCGECFNIQWPLFIAGWFFILPAMLGAALPLCQRGRLQDPSYRVGWMCNLALVTLWVILAIIGGVLGRHYNNQGNQGNTGNYYYG